MSFAVCAAWQWTQPNGTPCDAVCRGLLLWLHRAGHIVLPPPRWVTSKPWRPRTGAPPVLVDTSPLAASLRELGPLDIRQVRRSADEDSSTAHSRSTTIWAISSRSVSTSSIWSGPPAARSPVSRGRRPHGTSARAIGLSDGRLRPGAATLLAYNSPFLILPWVTVPHLASHVLGRMAALVSADWQRRYGHPIYFLETFIDPARFRGTCYRAANWRVLGRTTGRGHNAPTMRPTRPVKEILGYPLTPRFRQRLTAG